MPAPFREIDGWMLGYNNCLLGDAARSRWGPKSNRSPYLLVREGGLKNLKVCLSQSNEIALEQARLEVVSQLL